MSPGKFDNDQQARKEINGHQQRPSQLKINKDSHLIQKSSSSSSSTTSSSFNGIAAATTKHHQQQQRHHPVIIYTHSPKIIHTQARDFMALVQKLTGLSRSDDNQPVQPQSSQKENGQSSSLEGNNNNNSIRPSAGAVVHEDNESSSVVTDENCGGRGDIQVSSFSVSPPVFESPNPFFSDIPLFTPNSADFFCSPRPFYRYPDSVFTPSNVRSSISPSVLEVMKGFQEY
ncbi:LOW QUALITY PROTEIN: VQ motif-containing protein 20-like [Macadamia integrifolia]|uniref:LOW QUALITY PROTEIN: VQ motif-containing protein 20-like n=1 Tax=Macadamia integrifolia TaxID=60698 RepID=UPI001C4E93B5|nr:LOW QUALITY PROTEIN: VQ motif-containing protein 20-like [Macadamia integrifolia]